MSTLLPDELLLTLNEQVPCRELQIRQLATLLHVRAAHTNRKLRPS